jgi:hypothetical protein
VTAYQQQDRKRRRVPWPLSHDEEGAVEKAISGALFRLAWQRPPVRIVFSELPKS